jgi:hypothetical protein
LSENKPNFDWDLVLRNIVQTKTEAQALLAMKFTNKIIPDILPQSLLQNNVINKKFDRHCDRIIFQRFFFKDFRQRHKELNIKNALKNWKNFKEYVVSKPKYFLIKRIIRKSHFLMIIFMMINSKTYRIA